MASKPSSLRERAAQLVFPRLGSNMPPAISADDDFERVSRLLDEIPVGGLVLFHGDRVTTPACLRALQATSRFPLLVGSDLERGSGQQLSGGPVFPHAMAFGAAGDGAPAFVHHAAWLTARDAMAAGVHWLFAPVADVHSNPANPIISTRAYSRDPVVSADLVQAFIAGAHEGGAITTAKHFPGHGDTDTDSHEALPVVSRSREALEAVELVPFRAAIEAGVDTIMTAHVAYPAFGSGSLPATWSPVILRRLLRDELGFSGVVVSDSLLMAGAGAAVARKVPELVAAGVDVLLDLESPASAVDALVAAVENGALDEALLDAAFQRVWALKTRLMARFGPDVFLSPPAAPDAAAEGSRLALEIGRAGILQEGDVPADLPDHPDIRVLVVRPHTSYPDPTQASVEGIFGAVFPSSSVVSLGPEPADLDRVETSLAGADLVIAALVVKPAAWHRFGLLPEQQALLDRLVASRPVAICVLGSPDVMAQFPQSPLRLCGYSDVAASVQAVADRIAMLLNSGS